MVRHCPFLGGIWGQAQSQFNGTCICSLCKRKSYTWTLKASDKRAGVEQAGNKLWGRKQRWKLVSVRLDGWLLRLNKEDKIREQHGVNCQSRRESVKVCYQKNDWCGIFRADYDTDVRESQNSDIWYIDQYFIHITLFNLVIKYLWQRYVAQWRQDILHFNKLLPKHQSTEQETLHS